MLHWFIEMDKHHGLLLGILLYGVANVMITSLPSPDAKNGKFYRWFFNSAHGIILAIPRIVSQYYKPPEEPGK
jgi:hypothetical protein